MDDIRMVSVLDRAGHRPRSACLVAGCTCKDARIVSFRRAAFFAAVARHNSQTSDRLVSVDPDWRLPAPAA